MLAQIGTCIKVFKVIFMNIKKSYVFSFKIALGIIYFFPHTTSYICLLVFYGS